MAYTGIRSSRGDPSATVAYTVYIGVIWGYRDNRKEHGNYQSICSIVALANAVQHAICEHVPGVRLISSLAQLVYNPTCLLLLHHFARCEKKRSLAAKEGPFESSAILVPLLFSAQAPGDPFRNPLSLLATLGRGMCSIYHQSSLLHSQCRIGCRVRSC